MGRWDAIRGIYFDLWNTIAFTDHSPHPMAALAAAFGLESTPGWRGLLERAMMARRLSGIGEAIDAVASATGRAIRDPWSRRELVLIWGAASNRTRLYPDVLPTLRGLAAARGLRGRYRLGILSNTQSFDLDFMRREGLEAMMDAICLSCDCGLLKPDPEIFRLAASRVRLAPREILMVGDRLTEDVEAARRAGMQAILLDRAAESAGALQNLLDLMPRLQAGCPVTSS